MNKLCSQDKILLSSDNERTRSMCITMDWPKKVMLHEKKKSQNKIDISNFVMLVSGLFCEVFFNKKTVSIYEIKFLYCPVFCGSELIIHHFYFIYVCITI